MLSLRLAVVWGIVTASERAVPCGGRPSNRQGVEGIMIRFVLGVVAAGLFAWGPLTMEKPVFGAEQARVERVAVASAVGGYGVGSVYAVR